MFIHDSAKHYGWFVDFRRILQETAKECNGDRTTEDQVLLAKIALGFTVHLLTLLKVLGETKPLSDML